MRTDSHGRSALDEGLLTLAAPIAAGNVSDTTSGGEGGLELKAAAIRTFPVAELRARLRATVTEATVDPPTAFLAGVVIVIGPVVDLARLAHLRLPPAVG